MKKGKNYIAKSQLIDRTMQYDVDQALELVQKVGSAKFDETVEVHIRLGVDSRHAEQQVRGAVVLPHGTGRNIRVLAFAKGDKADEAQAAGADFVGAEELVSKIQNENWFDYDKVVATPDMMAILGRIARVLGPKGLMPNPKSGTVSADIGTAIKELKAGKVEYRLDRTNIMHVSIGKVSFGTEKLKENFETLLNAVKKAKPSAAKGQYLKSVTVTSTMSPGIKMNTSKLEAN